MPNDLPPHLPPLLQALRHEPPPGATEAQQVQAVFTMLAAQPRTLARAIWATRLLRTLQDVLTTVEEWQQWGAVVAAVLDELVQGYDPPPVDRMPDNSDEDTKCS